MLKVVNHTLDLCSKYVLAISPFLSSTLIITSHVTDMAWQDFVMNFGHSLFSPGALLGQWEEEIVQFVLGRN